MRTTTTPECAICATLLTSCDNLTRRLGNALEALQEIFSTPVGEDDKLDVIWRMRDIAQKALWAAPSESDPQGGEQ